VPFHACARVTVLPLLPTSAPAAVQARGEAQDTAKNALARAPAGRGVAWMAQFLPFHRSARGRAAPALVTYSPAAVQVRGDEQDTAKNPLASAPAGRGIAWIAQFLPFHRSARGRGRKLASR